MSKKKMYIIYNEMSQQFDSKTIMLYNNDNEAQYSHAISIEKFKENNPYFREQDFKLVCLGVVETEGENAGIIYDYKNDYPVKFDKIPNFWKPKHEEPSERNITVKDKAEKEKILNNMKGE